MNGFETKILCIEKVPDEEELIHAPKTYLLRWNPAVSSFTMERYRNAIDEYPEGFCMDWSIYE